MMFCCSQHSWKRKVGLFADAYCILSCMSLLFGGKSFYLIGTLTKGFLCYFFGRYFLRKLKKVKKSNGQILAINEVWTIYA
jgi:hypothetical protein